MGPPVIAERRGRLTAAAEKRSPTKQQLFDAALKKVCLATDLMLMTLTASPSRRGMAKANQNAVYFAGVAVYCDLPRE